MLNSTYFPHFILENVKDKKKQLWRIFFCVNRNEFTVKILSISMRIYSHNEVSENEVKKVEKYIITEKALQRIKHFTLCQQHSMASSMIP